MNAHCYALNYFSGEAPCADPTDDAKRERLIQRLDHHLVHKTFQRRAQMTVRQLSQRLREYESQIINVVAEASAAEWPGRVITQLSELPFST